MNYIFKTTNDTLLLSEQYNLVLNLFLGITGNTRLKIIYRGESLKNLSKKLNLEPSPTFFNRLNELIFNLGDKARVYQQHYRVGPEEVFAINDISRRLFEYIFEKFGDVFSRSTNREVLQFKSDNGLFVSYFSDENNRAVFINKITSLDVNKQLTIRDYYLKILHRIGMIGFFSNSFFVSTTSERKIAAKFSSSNDIILVGWNHYQPYVGKLLSGYELPTAVRDIYPYQREIPLKGGLLPHYIIGYIKNATNEFIVNPNLMLCPGELIPHIVNNGIPIDQRNFHNLLSRTNYGGYFTETNDGFFDTLNE